MLTSYVVLGYDFEYVISSILKVHLCSFNECFYWMFLNLIKETNREREQINSLLSKGISNKKVAMEKN